MAVREYNFDLTKNYPSERRYLIKRPLKKSVLDSIRDLLWKK